MPARGSSWRPHLAHDDFIFDRMTIALSVKSRPQDFQIPEDVRLELKKGGVGCFNWLKERPHVVHQLTEEVQKSSAGVLAHYQELTTLGGKARQGGSVRVWDSRSSSKARSSPKRSAAPSEKESQAS
jgi:hypothetical protein